MNGPDEPTIRFKTLPSGRQVFDEFIADAAEVHVEQMTSTHWWIGVTVGDRRWSIDFETARESIRGACYQDEGPGSE